MHGKILSAEQKPSRIEEGVLNDMHGWRKGLKTKRWHHVTQVIFLQEQASALEEANAVRFFFWPKKRRLKKKRSEIEDVSSLFSVCV